MPAKPHSKSIEELRAQAAIDVPYVIGQGTQSLQKRARRLKVLLSAYGYRATDLLNQYIPPTQYDARGYSGQHPTGD